MFEAGQAAAGFEASQAARDCRIYERGPQDSSVNTIDSEDPADCECARIRLTQEDRNRVNETEKTQDQSDYTTSREHGLKFDPDHRSQLVCLIRCARIDRILLDFR